MSTASNAAEVPLLADIELVNATRVTPPDKGDDVEEDKDELLSDEAENMRQLAADFDDLVP